MWSSRSDSSARACSTDVVEAATTGLSSGRVRCSALSRGAEEDLAGTASTVRRWLLVEQPGPWGTDALRESRLNPHVAQGLASVGREQQARVLLIRRHGRPATLGPRTAFAAHTTPGRHWIERIDFDDPRELLDWDWKGFDGDSVGGRPVTEPVFLVCTNGRHDACCAELGRPLAEALSTYEPDATWESSHFGGDRFAGNLVCLPAGLYYGRVGPDEAGGVAAAHREGRLSLAHFRGRSSMPFGVQAAEIALRRHLSVDGIDDVAMTARDRIDGDTIRVRFHVLGKRAAVVEVRTRTDTDPRPLSCGADAVSPPRFETRVIEHPADDGGS